MDVPNILNILINKFIWKDVNSGYTPSKMIFVKKRDLFYDMVSHPPICPYIIVVCARDKGKVKFLDFDIHKRCLCSENIIKCKYCNSSMKKKLI